jgi:hypothetical protein
MRPDDPRYRALRLADVPDTDAKLAFMISAWGSYFRLTVTTSQRRKAIRTW